MEIKYVLLVIAVITIMMMYAGAESDYCQIFPNHILCGKKNFSATCGESSFIKWEIPDETNQVEILKLHNTFRNGVAGGNESRAVGGTLPTGSNIAELVWDSELAELAGEYVKNCVNEPSCTNCRQLDRFLVGENIHSTRLPFHGPTPDKLAWEVIFSDWTQNEFQFFLKNDTENFVNLNSAGNKFTDFGHLTQIMWANTLYVGCAQIYFVNGEIWEVISICNYGPMGNVLDTPIYETGDPCSNCQANWTCSSEYSNLCISESFELDTSSPEEDEIVGTPNNETNKGEAIVFPKEE